MKAHRREIERRKRHAAIEKLHLEQQVADTRRKIWKVTAWTVVILVVAFGYRSLQDSYGNQWPIWDVWLLLGRRSSEHRLAPLVPEPPRAVEGP